MCIAIYQPSYTEINDFTLETCYFNNPDGMGFMYVKNGKIVIVKELKNFDYFLTMYHKALRCNLDASFVLHFRIATHGKIDLANCHPFRVNSELAFCHNGILDIDSTEKVSDTRMFAKTILRKLPANWLHNDAIVELVESYIGEYNKMVFLSNTGEVSILNEHKGVWDNGVWYSNRSYKDYSFFVGDVKSDELCEICSQPLMVREYKYCNKCYMGF